ncbi:hypothetical protein U9M48_009904 [Paspalum notatum var. saurae]|uniref:Uncharacterized protein n=1 Tax=Paspalum notatum var. saurae TaxID=547442 RepID=A0AAQ3SSU5_PASNO
MAPASSTAAAQRSAMAPMGTRRADGEKREIEERDTEKWKRIYSTGWSRSRARTRSYLSRMVHMEKLVNHCDMELMKMAMLRHEATFRQQVARQVHELHRLYRVQKQLMSGLSPSELSCRRRIRRRQPPRRIVITQPSTEDGLELTLAVGGASRRRKRRDETESTDTAGTPTPLGSDSGGSLTPSSSSTDTVTAGSPRQRAVAFSLQEGTTVTVIKQPQQSPWPLVQCLGLKMA